MTKVYNISDTVVIIPGYGEIEPGDFFEADDAEAERYYQLDRFGAKAASSASKKSKAKSEAANGEDD